MCSVYGKHVQQAQLVSDPVYHFFPWQIVEWRWCKALARYSFHIWRTHTHAVNAHWMCDFCQSQYNSQAVLFLCEFYEFCQVHVMCPPLIPCLLIADTYTSLHCRLTVLALNMFAVQLFIILSSAGVSAYCLCLFVPAEYCSKMSYPQWVCKATAKQVMPQSPIVCRDI